MQRWTWNVLVSSGLLWLCLPGLLSGCEVGCGKQGEAVTSVEALPESVFTSQLRQRPEAVQQKLLAEMQRLGLSAQAVEELRLQGDGIIHICRHHGLAAEAEVSAPSAAAPSEASVAATVSSVPIYHSRPGATHRLILDFDGAVVNNHWGSYDVGAFSLDSDRSTFNASEQDFIRRLWERVAEDFAPFDIDVTTEDTGDYGPKVGQVLISPNKDKNGNFCPYAGVSGVAGVAFTGPYGASDYASYAPAWVYYEKLSKLADFTAEAASHEFGHNLGLGHDGKNAAGYYSGHGSGETSWGPIMGTPFGRNKSQWSNGDYSGANNQENDLAKMKNRLGLVADDHGDELGEATELAGTSVDLEGLIESNSDVDMFQIVCGDGSLELSVQPWRADDRSHGGNLDVRVQLFDEAGGLVADFDPNADTDVQVTHPITAGVYYLAISGSGVRVNPPVDNSWNLTSGYSDYGSIGTYTMTGTWPLGDGNARPQVAIVSPSVSQLQVSQVPVMLQLHAEISDDGLPDPPAALSSTWSRISGPDAVLFADASAPMTMATITAEGTYVLRCTASDGDKEGSAEVTIIIDSGGSPPGVPPTADLIVHYPCDDSAGTLVADAAGGDHPGTLSGGQWLPEAGVRGGAIAFDGIDDRIEIANSSAINEGSFSARSIALWFRADALVGKQFLYEEGGGTRGLCLYLDDDRLYIGGWNNGENGWDETFLSTAGIAVDTWHHVALVLDGGNSLQPEGLTGYLDGVAFASGGGATINSHSGDIRLGAAGNTRTHDSSSAGAAAFGGRLDDFLLYNRALNAAAIAELVGGGLVAPIVDAGPDQAAAPLVATLSGRVVSSLPVSSQWQVVDGPAGAVFADASAAATTVSFAAPGTYRLRLSADDGRVVIFDELSISADGSLRRVTLRLLEGEAWATLEPLGFDFAAANGELQSIDYPPSLTLRAISGVPITEQ